MKPDSKATKRTDLKVTKSAIKVTKSDPTAAKSDSKDTEPSDSKAGKPAESKPKDAGAKIASPKPSKEMFQNERTCLNPKTSFSPSHGMILHYFVQIK